MLQYFLKIIYILWAMYQWRICGVSRDGIKNCTEFQIYVTIFKIQNSSNPWSMAIAKFESTFYIILNMIFLIPDCWSQTADTQWMISIKLPSVESTFSQASFPPNTSSTSFNLGYFLLDICKTNNYISIFL